MRRTEQAQGLRLMKFEEVYGHTVRGELSQAEAAEILGTSERTFRRWRDRFEAEGAEGLYDRRLGRLSARRAPVDEVARVLALAGIGGIEEANRFLKEVYLPQHNARFQVTPEADGSAFVPFAGALDDILCIQEERTVSERQHRALQAPPPAAPRRPPPSPLRQGHGQGARVSRRHVGRLPRPPMPGPIPGHGRAHRHANPAGRVSRFDATGRGLWTSGQPLRA